MANFVRQIVSGRKARFKDKDLNLELDLVYVTDHIIIMGFPAAGVKGIYRNRREDAKKFLDHRHGENYWIFNFCPLRENSYPSSFFHGRVSRYPFPDHHAPPLAILPLFVREAREWLSGSPDRVAVLHCKAGKGRSGTLACAYLLSLDKTPTPPKLQRSMAKKEWAKQRADDILKTVEVEDADAEAQELKVVRAEEGKGEGSTKLNSEGGAPPVVSGPPANALLDSDPTRRPGTSDSADVPKPEKGVLLDDVLALHTAQRMRLSSSPNKRPRHGVSIPSQRRWLHYWSQLLANAAPRNFWQVPLPRVRLLEIRVRVRVGMKAKLVSFANRLIEKTNRAKYGEQQRGRGPVWVSLARYDDKFVDTLERWEKHTRMKDGNLGKRREGSDYMPEESELSELFTDGKWDKFKMIRSFGRLGHLDGLPVIQRSEDGIVVCHTLRPLTEQKWEVLQEAIGEPVARRSIDSESRRSVTIRPNREAESSTRTSDIGLAHSTNHTSREKGVVLDAAREVRAKIYMGQVFMGWFWFIPAFHMPLVSTSSASEDQIPSHTTHFVLTREHIDFPIGAGAALIDVDVALEWVSPSRTPSQIDRNTQNRDTDRKCLVRSDSASVPGSRLQLSDPSDGKVMEAPQ